MPLYRNSLGTRAFCWPLYVVGLLAASIAAACATLGSFEIYCYARTSSTSDYSYASAFFLFGHAGAVILESSCYARNSSSSFCGGSEAAAVLDGLVRVVGRSGGDAAAPAANALLTLSASLLLALALTPSVGAYWAARFHEAGREGFVDSERPAMVRWAAAQALLTLSAAVLSMCAVAAFNLGFNAPVRGSTEFAAGNTNGTTCGVVWWYGSLAAWISVAFNLLLGSIPLAVLHSICIPRLSAAAAAAAASAKQTRNPASVIVDGAALPSAPSVRICGLFSMRL